MRLRGLALLMVLAGAFPASAQTRLYLYLSTTAAVTPTVRGTWDDTAERLNRATGTTKELTAITIGQVVDLATTGNHRDLDRVYVSDPLDGNQTIPGTATVTGVLMTREYAATDNIDSVHFGLFVVSNDGATLRCTLLATTDYVARAEFVNNATHRNKRIADGDTVSAACSALNGDRLQLEIGYRVATGGGTSPQASGKFGDNATDCAENETNTTDCAGWVQLSTTLAFQTASGGAGRAFADDDDEDESS